MTKTTLTGIGLTLFIVASLFAGSHPPITYKVAYPNLTTLERLELDVRNAQSSVANPIAGTKALVDQQQREQAKKDLVTAQARLDGFKTAGPKMDIPLYEKAIRDDQYAIEHWGGGKMIYGLQQRDAAKAKLAKDQAALEALKGL